MEVYLNSFIKCCVYMFNFIFNIDIDECTSGLNVCPTVSTCINTDGSYYCKCNEGYFQSNSYSCSGNSLVIRWENVILFFLVYCFVRESIHYTFVIATFHSVFVFCHQIFFFYSNSARIIPRMYSYDEYKITSYRKHLENQLSDLDLVCFLESSVYGIDLRIQKINGSDATYSVELNDSSSSEFQTLASNLKQIVCLFSLFIPNF